MDLNVIKTYQQNVESYTTVITVDDLQRVHRIDWWDELNPNGYQRSLDHSRLSKIVKYIMHEEGLFPTNIVCNIRNKVDFYPHTYIGNYAEMGILRIPSSIPIWIIDGQHRLYSLMLAAREDPSLKDYAFPVTIFNFENKYDEMRQFYVINDRQKRVRTDLAQRHLFRTINEQGELDLLQFETKDKIYSAQVMLVVDYLRLHSKSPWFNRIQIPTDLKKDKMHIITQNSMAKSLNPILKHMTYEQRKEIMETPSVLADPLIEYWSSIKTLLPDAFANPKEYQIQKTFGCTMFNLLYPDLISYIERESLSGANLIRDVLINTFNDFEEREGVNALSSDFWHKKTGHIYTQGSGMKSVRFLYRKFCEYLEEDDTLEE